MDGMNGTEAHDAPQPDVVAEMVAAALATRPTALRTSAYDDARQEAADDLELAAEWQMASDALAHDENQALRMLARQRTDERTHTAWLESQVYARGRKLHAAYARIVSLEREIDALRAENAALREERDTLAAKLDAAHAAEAQRVALETERDAERDKVRKLATERLRLMSEANGSRAEAKARTTDNRALLKNLAHANERAETAVAMLADTTREMNALRNDLKALTEERDTLAAKLDAAHARLAERENAALVADATDVCAGFSAAALYRMYTLEKRISEERRRAVERLTARLNGAQIAADIGLDGAHEDDDDATPATLGDKPRKVWTEDVKRAILTALVEVPRNLSEMRADGWMAEVPDRQFAACILEMSRTWQLMRPVPGAPEGTYELTPDGADSARAMLADAYEAMIATLGDRRQQETRSIEWTPPTRSKPDAAA